MSDDAQSWIFLQLDEKNARRSGTPQQVPIQKKDMEAVADTGLTAELARKSITAFLQAAPSSWRGQNAALAKAFDMYVGKAMYCDRAEVASRKRDTDGAIAALKMIVRLDKEDHGARMNLGAAHAKKGDYPAARAELEAIEETFEGDADYHVLRGQVVLAMEDQEAALEQFVLALEANPESKAALDALVKLGALVPIYEDPRDPTSLVYLRSDGIAESLAALWAEQGASVNLLEQLAYHESEGRHEVVVAAADALLARADETPEHKERAATARIAALRELKRNDEAMAAAKALVADKPSAAAHVELARCFAQAGDPDAGRAELDKALALDPGDALAIRLRYWPANPDDLGALQAALPKLEALAKEHPAVPGVIRSLARAKLLAGGADEAIALLERAVELDPSRDDLRAELWAELVKLGRAEQVVAHAQKVENLARRSWTLRWAEAEAYERLGKKPEASAAFMAIAADDSLHATIRKRARRAAGSVMA